MAVRQKPVQKEIATEVADAPRRKPKPQRSERAEVELTGRALHELTGMEKIRKVRQGMTRQDLEQVKDSFGLDYETLAKILSVAKATLFNKKGTATFSASLSEKIFAMADLYSYGLSVFGEKDKLNRWMEKENRALGYVRPLELLDTLIGIDEVKNILGRIEHGVYS